MSTQKWDAELYEASHRFVWQLGQGLVDLLHPQSGERILDIGCGTGHLTAKIAESGAHVTGLDASAAMIGQARQNFPKLSFALDSVTTMHYTAEFDALFSNAALHWVLDAASAAQAMSRALKKGGRLVAEMGGRGNIQTIEQAIIAKLGRVPSNNYFPSIAEYSTILEAAGLDVRRAELYDRPTPLEGEDGMANWIRQFKWFYFEALPADQQTAALAAILADLAPSLHTSNGWFADYRRLRLVAVKI